MNTKNRILTTVILCTLALSACGAPKPTPESAETSMPAAAAPTHLPPTLHPEVNVALNKPVRVSASWVVDPPERAVDGNVNNWWGAGGPVPQWIEVDLQGLYKISRIRVINQGPTGLAAYRILGRGIGYQYQLLYTFNNVKTENQTLEFSPETAWEDVSVIRIEIPDGSGWVGFREVMVFSREDPKPLPVSARSGTPLFLSGVDASTLEPITADNAIMMEQLSMLGWGEINKLIWSPDGRIVAAASTLGIWLYDPADLNAPPRLLKGHTRDVFSVAFSPDGKTVLSGSQDGTVKQWDSATGDLKRSISLWDDFSYEIGDADRNKEVWSMAFSPDGTLLATGNYDGTLRLWNLATGKARAFVKGHDKTVTALAFSPDGTMLVSSGAERVLYVWDLASGNLRTTLFSQGQVTSVTFSPDGNTLAYGGVGTTVQLWNTSSGEARVELSEPNGVLNLALSRDGLTLASSSLDGALRFWDSESGSTRIFHDGAGWITSMAFSPDGTNLISCTWDGTLQLWETATGNLIASTANHTAPVNAIAFSPDGKILASGGSDSRVRLWDVETNSQRGILHGHIDSVTGVAFSPDGKVLASSSFDRTVRLWDVSSGSQIQTLEGHGSLVRCVAFSPDGKLVASGGTDKTVRLWDVETGKERAMLTGHTSEVEVVMFSQDGLWLLSGSADKTIRIWEVATGKEIGFFSGNNGFVLSAAFSPDGTLISAAGGDFGLRVFKWGINAGKISYQLKFPAIGHGGWVMATTFSPDGTLVADASLYSSAYWVTPGEIHLYSAETGFPVNLLRGHTKRVTSVAFSPDGKLLASGSADGSVRLWGVVH